MSDQTREDVLKAMEGDGGTPPQEQPKEAVVTPEPTAPAEPVKPEEPKAPEVKPEEVDVVKLKGEIDNYKTALSQERQAKRQDAEKIAALEAEVKQATDMMSRIKGAVAPEKEEEPAAPVYLTQQEVENILVQKEQERAAKELEQSRANQIKAEITELEKEWDGSESKPKYDDDKVLNWQKDNQRLHLTPREAFYEMSRKDIIDWEVNQRLKGKTPVQNVEKPTTTPNVHEPDSKAAPKSEAETRQAVIDAMDAADKEM